MTPQSCVALNTRKSLFFQFLCIQLYRYFKLPSGLQSIEARKTMLHEG